MDVARPVRALRGAEKPLRAYVRIGCHTRGVLESAGRGRESALVASAGRDPVESPGNGVVRAAGGVRLVPEALVAA